MPSRHSSAVRSSDAQRGIDRDSASRGLTGTSRRVWILAILSKQICTRFWTHGNRCSTCFVFFPVPNLVVIDLPAVLSVWAITLTFSPALIPTALTEQTVLPTLLDQSHTGPLHRKTAPLFPLRPGSANHVTTQDIHSGSAALVLLRAHIQPSLSPHIDIDVYGTVAIRKLIRRPQS